MFIQHIMLAVIITIMTCGSLYAQNYSLNSNLSQRKTINTDFFNNEVVRVIALPVTDFNVDFYYRVEEYNQRLTDKDIDRIGQVVGQQLNVGFSQLLQGLTQAIQQITPKPQEPFVPVVEPIFPSEPSGPNNEEPQQPSPQPSPQLSPQPQENPETPQQPGLLVTPEINSIVQSNCVVCHNGNKKSKYDFTKYVRFVSDTTGWTPMNPVDAWVVFDEVHSANMPKNAAPLSQGDTNKFQGWARSNSL